jgi:3-hydroxyisobutyrate dehydrogenase
MEKAALRVGWIGTGVMGKSMVGHLIKNGYQLSIYTRTKAKAEELIQSGATYQEPIEIAKQSDFLFVMVGYPHDVEQVILAPETGVLHHMKAGSVLIDHTTSSPGLAMRIYEEA